MSRQGPQPGVRERATDDGDETDRAVVLGVNGTDGDRAGPLADTTADIAGPVYATVHVVHVFAGGAYERTLDQLNCDEASPPSPDELVQRRTAVREVTARLADPAREYGMPVAVHGRVADDVGAALVDVAYEVDASGIVVGGRKRSPVGKATVGSTVQTVLRNAPCPVTFVRGG